MAKKRSQAEECPVTIPVGEIRLHGDLCMPESAIGVVVFAHGSGSSRKSPRNRYVAGVLREAGLGTLLFDLLTAEEEVEDLQTGELRFNIGLLSRRLVEVTDWLKDEPQVKGMKMGYFGASTGAAAALIAAAARPNLVGAVVSRGGRPDLAAEVLNKVKAPTLLVVGGDDYQVIQMNREALALLKAEKEIQIVPGATHLFEEPGTLEQVAKLASDWFVKHLKKES